MLPFLKKKQIAAVVYSKMKPSGQVEDEKQDSSEGRVELEACAESLIRAINRNDVSAVADALKSAFDVLEAQPHEEYEHEEESEE